MDDGVWMNFSAMTATYPDGYVGDIVDLTRIRDPNGGDRIAYGIVAKTKDGRFGSWLWGDAPEELPDGQLMPTEGGHDA